MQDLFEIVGTHMKYSEIQDYRIVQCEYIYRPVYREIIQSGLWGRVNSSYEFGGMRPYAAILDENVRKTAVGAIQPGDLLGAMAKDAWEGAAELLGNALHIRGQQKVKYQCVNQTHRHFETYLDDIPALLMRRDGKVSDVFKNDELYHLLGEPIAPAINIIPALAIKAKENFLFFGDSIQIADPGKEYARLGSELAAYEAVKKEQARLAPPLGIPLLQGIQNLFAPKAPDVHEPAHLPAEATKKEEL